MLDDPALAAPVKAQLARLQVAVTRLALEDATLLRDESHPTWRLINAIAAYAGGFADANDARLQEFLRFLEDQTAALVQSPQPSSQQFEYLLRLVDAFIARQARERSAPSEAELATLERERQSGAWLKLLREQLDELARRAGLGPHARRFLHARWSVLIVQAMVREGQDGVLVQRLLHWVDPLIDSLRERIAIRPRGGQIRADDAARAELRLQLPALVSGIESLLEPLGLDPEQRQALMDALMKLHGRLMVQTAATQAGTADARASELPGETQAAADDASSSSARAATPRCGRTPRSTARRCRPSRCPCPTAPRPSNRSRPGCGWTACAWVAGSTCSSTASGAPPSWSGSAANATSSCSSARTPDNVTH